MSCRPCLILFACVAIGCGSSRAPDVSSPDSPVLATVQSIVAEHLGKKMADVKPEMTFAALGADELDLVEIVMEVEDRFGMTISDDALTNASGPGEPDRLHQRLTIRAFAAVAEKAPKATGR